MNKAKNKSQAQLEARKSLMPFLIWRAQAVLAIFIGAFVSWIFRSYVSPLPDIIILIVVAFIANYIITRFWKA